MNIFKIDCNIYTRKKIQMYVLTFRKANNSFCNFCRSAECWGPFALMNLNILMRYLVLFSPRENIFMITHSNFHLLQKQSTVIVLWISDGI